MQQEIIIRLEKIIKILPDFTHAAKQSQFGSLKDPDWINIFMTKNLDQHSNKRERYKETFLKLGKELASLTNEIKTILKTIDKNLISQHIKNLIDTIKNFDFALGQDEIEKKIAPADLSDVVEFIKTVKYVIQFEIAESLKIAVAEAEASNESNVNQITESTNPNNDKSNTNNNNPTPKNQPGKTKVSEEPEESEDFSSSSQFTNQGGFQN